MTNSRLAIEPLLRVVLDTNILISACLKPQGLEARIVQLVLRSRLIACITDQILAEYRDVLFRPKFQALHQTAAAMLDRLARVWVHVTAGEPISAASDEDDNRFLECAGAARAHFLITGNLRHYPAECAGTYIVNSRGFLDLYPELCIN